MDNVLTDYKFVITLQDYARVECQAIAIDSLAGLVYTSNPNHLTIRITDIAMITIQGEY